MGTGVDVRLRCHWAPIVILHWDRRNCWMGKGHLAQRIISPPRKCLNTISLLSHCSCLLCLSHMMFVCCLHKVQISWKAINVHLLMRPGKCLYSAQFPFYLSFFDIFFFWLLFVCLFLGVYTRLSTVFSGFQDLQGHN